MDITESGRYGDVVTVNDWYSILQSIKASFDYHEKTIEAGKRQGEYYRSHFLYQNIISKNERIQEFFEEKK